VESLCKEFPTWSGHRIFQINSNVFPIKGDYITLSDFQNLLYWFGRFKSPGTTNSTITSSTTSSTTISTTTTTTTTITSTSAPVPNTSATICPFLVQIDKTCRQKWFWGKIKPGVATIEEKHGFVVSLNVGINHPIEKAPFTILFWDPDFKAARAERFYVSEDRSGFFF